MKIYKYTQYSIIILLFVFLSCSSSYTPKPRGYFRISFPEKEYVKFNNQGPYSFEIPKYSFVQIDSSQFTEKWWINIILPTMKGKIHISYKTVNDNLNKYLEDSRELAYKHTVKAEAINEEIFVNNKNNVFGVLYEIKGNVASSYQFYVTDSTKHFLRGALYFNVYPNKDSLAPVLKFVKEDIINLMETFEWNNK
ncbi:MAG: gliding motility lipoprotein GldD [Bacteroidales bacterium]|nr:gliding motility lipoprotein GldD [Bacteroidales bacterium]MBN2755665.1 gliding motility lipoprotein GldD [Bacteroidales bacterium]